MLPDWKKVGAISKFQKEKLNERDLQEGLGVGGRTILELRNWIDSAHYIDYWGVHVNVALNLRFS